MGTSTLDNLERESAEDAAPTPGISAPATVGMTASKNARHCSAETPGRDRIAQFAMLARTSGTAIKVAYCTSRVQSSGALSSILRSSLANYRPSAFSLPRARCSDRHVPLLAAMGRWPLASTGDNPRAQLHASHDIQTLGYSCDALLIENKDCCGIRTTGPIWMCTVGVAEVDFNISV